MNYGRFIKILIIAFVCLVPFFPVRTSKANPVKVCFYEDVIVQVKTALNVDDTDGVQVPIERKDRVRNKTGVQCVWSSHETLARYAEIKELYDITDMREYKSYAGPDNARRMLERFNIKYKMTTTKDVSLLDQACRVEHRGATFDVPGHMMTLVHFSQKDGIVKYIDNSDKTLAIRTMSMKEFMRRWCGWAVVIYGEPDKVPFIANPWRIIPIKNNKKPLGFIPSP